MAWDVASCHRMADAAAQEQAPPGDRLPALLQPDLPRRLRRPHQEGPAGRHLLHPQRLAPERSPGAARRSRPSPDFDPKQWGYDNWEHLVNWRLYKQVLAAACWPSWAATRSRSPTGSSRARPRRCTPRAASTAYKDGREVPDHVYATFDYDGRPHGHLHLDRSRTPSTTTTSRCWAPRGRSSSSGETEAYYFPEGEAAAKSTNLEVTKRSGNAIVDASESRTADAAGAHRRRQAPGREVRAPALLPQRDQRLLLRDPHRHPAGLWAPNTPSAAPPPASAPTRPATRRPASRSPDLPPPPTGGGVSGGPQLRGKSADGISAYRWISPCAPNIESERS